jgi:hypothetical protein
LDEDVDALTYLIDAGNERAGDLLAALAAGRQDVETLLSRVILDTK